MRKKGSSHDRPFDGGASGKSICLSRIIDLLDSAFAALPKSVREQETSRQAFARLKKRVSSWAGVEIVGNGFGRNYTAQDLSDGWHIDIEVSGRIDIKDC